MSIETKITWHDPNETTPPFGRRILAALGSMRSSGAGFMDHMEIKAVTIKTADCDGDVIEGRKMRNELTSGESKWEDLQFLLADDDGEPLDYTSDSIEWYADMPVLPFREKAGG
jgi:hypothetical protein